MVDTMSATASLQELQHSLRSLDGQRQSLHQQLQSLIASVQAPQHDPGRRVDHVQVHELATQLEGATQLRQTVLSLKAMVEPIREAEKLLRAADGLASQEDQFNAYTARLLEVTDTLAQASAGRQSASQLATASTDPTVAQLQSSFDSRLEAAKQWLHTSVTSQIQSLLTTCNWPPPLTGDPASSQPGTPMRGGGTPMRAGTPGPPGTPQRPTFFGRPGTPATPSHRGGFFPPAGPFEGEGVQEALHKLRKLLVVLTSMQSREQMANPPPPQEEGQPDEPPPVMWFALQLAQPLGARLADQFALEMPTGRIDHPEWLLSTSLRLTRQYSPLLDDLFQGAVEAAGLGGQYNIALEFPRAMREEVKGVLRDVRLPAVSQQAPALQHVLWPRYIDSLLQYEAKMAPLMGLLVKDPQDLPPALLLGSTLDLLCSHDPWLDGWAEAERAAQQAAVDDALYSDEGWAPAAGPGGVEDESGSTPAWQREFYPTAGAERVASLVEDCLLRARCIPRAGPQRRFVDSVAGDLLQVAYGRMLRILQQADNFRDLLSPHWAPKVSACICAAHYLEHHLTELPTSAIALHLLPPPTPSPSSSAPPTNRRTPQRLFAKHTANFSTLRRERALKLAKQASSALREGTLPYRRAQGAFATMPLSVEEPLPSPHLVRAVEAVREVLLRLSACLDATAFREVWKAVAFSANRSLFNDVAVTAHFSVGGVQQFAVDAAAVMGAFAPFTAKPGAHFRELREALRLLQLDGQATEDLLVRLQQAVAAGGADVPRLVAAAGAPNLAPAQAFHILRSKTFE